jgi:hypothetical protein
MRVANGRRLDSTRQEQSQATCRRSCRLLLPDSRGQAVLMLRRGCCVAKPVARRAIARGSKRWCGPWQPAALAVRAGRISLHRHGWTATAWSRRPGLTAILTNPAALAYRTGAIAI